MSVRLVNTPPLPSGANGRLKLLLPNGTCASLVGGPYYSKPSHLKGVKMAAEINMPCDISIPTRDFSVPDEKDFKLGVLGTLALLSSHKEVYVGCMGGIGRTGLLMAGVVKVLAPRQDSVKYVREHYIPHAVETEEQQRYIKNFDVEKLNRIIKWF